MKIYFGFQSKGSPQFAFKHLDFTDGQGRGRGLPSYRGRGEQKRGNDWVTEGFSNRAWQSTMYKHVIQPRNYVTIKYVRIEIFFISSLHFLGK